MQCAGSHISSSSHSLALMFRRYIALIFTGLSLALAGPTAPPFHLKERIDPPRHWVKLGPAPVDHVVTLRIALPQPNFSVLEQHLYEVSDPGHARYGEHLSKDEVESLVAPHPASLDAVEAWLLGHGLEREACTHSPARDWITVDVPVRLAEEMLDTVSPARAHLDVFSRSQAILIRVIMSGNMLWMAMS